MCVAGNNSSELIEIFIIFPFLRIVLYVGSNAGQGILVPDDVVIESRLPGEIGIAVNLRPTCNG